MSAVKTVPSTCWTFEVFELPGPTNPCERSLVFGGGDIREEAVLSLRRSWTFYTDADHRYSVQATLQERCCRCNGDGKVLKRGQANWATPERVCPDCRGKAKPVQRFTSLEEIA